MDGYSDLLYLDPHLIVPAVEMPWFQVLLWITEVDYL